MRAIPRFKLQKRDRNPTTLLITNVESEISPHLQSHCTDIREFSMSVAYAALAAAGTGALLRMRELLDAMLAPLAQKKEKKKRRPFFIQKLCAMVPHYCMSVLVNVDRFALS